MAKKTKKVKIAGRLGSKYGSTVRKKWNSIMTKKIKKECSHDGTDPGHATAHAH